MSTSRAVIARLQPLKFDSLQAGLQTRAQNVCTRRRLRNAIPCGPTLVENALLCTRQSEHGALILVVQRVLDYLSSAELRA